MEKELKVINKNGVLLVDSRDVAEMIGKRHTDLMRSIRNYVEVISENPKLRFQDFFVESTYKVEGNNKTYDCYLLTRKGCDMVANKMTGEKGILFTAEYVTKFEEMEKTLKEINSPSYLIDDRIERAKAWIREEEERRKLLEENEKNKPKVEYCDKVLIPSDTANGFTKLLTVTEIAKDLGMTARKLNSVLNELGIIFKQGKVWYLYSEYQDRVPKYCDDVVSEYSQTLKFTELGRQWIIETLEEEGII